MCSLYMSIFDLFLSERLCGYHLPSVDSCSATNLSTSANSSRVKYFIAILTVIQIGQYFILGLEEAAIIGLSV